MRVRGFIALLAFVVAPPAQAQPASPPHAPIAAGTPCELAGVLLAQMGGALYDAEPFKPMPLQASAGSAAPPPGVPADLAAKWNANGRGNALQTCPGIAPPGLKLATEADRAATRGIQHATPLHQLSAPIANAAGDHVLIELRQRCAQLCGAGELRHYQKTARGWIELPKLGLWMS